MTPSKGNGGYGSRRVWKLSGFCMSRMRKDDSRGSDSDGESFEAITPEHNSGTPEEPERYTGERHRHILEDVDGELEMEDVTPEAELNSANDVGGISNHISNEEAMVTSLAPPLPNGVPPSSPPLPTSPPPPNVHPPHLPPLHVPHQNQSIPSPPIHPPPVIHILSATHTVCPPHSHSQPLSSAHSVPLHPSVRPLPPSAAVCPPPVYLPVTVHPSTDMVVNGADLVVFGCKNNSVDNLPPGSPLA
uniref:Uncharacterized protein n=1 Tax=Kalanchoe fedtschenkoi TaxID=63787 RepID=A0A7N0T3G8_KALFE